MTKDQQQYEQGLQKALNYIAELGADKQRLYDEIQRKNDEIVALCGMKNRIRIWLSQLSKFCILGPVAVEDGTSKRLENSIWIERVREYAKTALKILEETKED